MGLMPRSLLRGDSLVAVIYHKNTKHTMTNVDNNHKSHMIILAYWHLGNHRQVYSLIMRRCKLVEVRVLLIPATLINACGVR